MSIVEIIKHYQRSIEKCQGDRERTLHCVKKLYNLPITVKHLQDTGIGRTVNALRKYEGDCGDAAKACVAKWKEMVVAEESSDAETEEQLPNDSNSHHSPPENVEQNSRSHGEDRSRSRADRSSSIESMEKKTSKRDSSTNKVRDKLGEENVKKHRESDTSLKHRESGSSSKYRESDTSSKHRESGSSSKHRESSSSSKHRESVSSSKHRESGSSSRHSTEDDECRPKVNGSSKRKSSHSDSDRKRESSKSQEESSPRKESSKKRRRDENSDNGERHHGSRHREKEKEKDRKKNKGNIQTEDGIDCLSGASFAEALGMASVKSRSSPTSRSPSKPSRTVMSPAKSSKSSSAPGSSRTAAVNSPAEFDFLSSPAQLEPLDTNLAVSIELPPINPNYRPLPNAYNPFDPPTPCKKVKAVTDGEALAQLMYHKAERTRVYSGVKGTRRGEPASLFDSCVRVLQDNIDALGFTGGVPYSILKPVLERASPEQLMELEHYNPYLIGETDELWEFHAKKQFRTMQRQEMESYRELYQRGLDERAAKLEALKSNIKQAQALSVPVRKAKMTYMDSVAKPPREVARQQAKNGTARPLPRGVPSSSGAAPVKPAAVVPTKQKPRVAPLMQKVMKFAKTFKR